MLVRFDPFGAYVQPLFGAGHRVIRGRPGGVVPVRRGRVRAGFCAAGATAVTVDVGLVSGGAAQLVILIQPRLFRLSQLGVSVDARGVFDFVLGVGDAEFPVGGGVGAV